jgi:hypothetical protein
LTEVVEPIQATGLEFTFDVAGSADSALGTGAALPGPGLSPDVPAAPIHCRRPMILVETPADRTAALEWACECGFRKDSGPAGTLHPLDTVWLAAARLESLQWELDAAYQSLGKTIRAAAAHGADPSALRSAAGLTEAEFQAVLR